MILFIINALPRFSLQTLVQFNGLYDILCALTILNIIWIPVLDNIHLSMFQYEEGPRSSRMLAYWVFTYGIIRLFGNTSLVSLSYCLEALVFLNEWFHGSVYTGKTLFVIIFSIVLGVLTR